MKQIIQKHRDRIDSLTNEIFYAVTCIANGIDADAKEKNTLRVALQRLGRKSGFPDEGDSKINVGTIPIPAWTGERWKEAVATLLDGESP